MDAIRQVFILGLLPAAVFPQRFSFFTVSAKCSYGAHQRKNAECFGLQIAGKMNLQHSFLLQKHSSCIVCSGSDFSWNCRVYAEFYETEFHNSIFCYHLPVVETCLKKWLWGPFFQNQGTFFDFQKRAGEAFPLPPSCVPVNAAECASIFLNNIPKCPWKCLNK